MERELLVKPEKPDASVLSLTERIARKTGFLVEQAGGKRIFVCRHRSAKLHENGLVEGDEILSRSIAMLLLSCASALALKRFMPSAKVGYKREGCALDSWAYAVDQRGFKIVVIPLGPTIVKVSCGSEHTLLQLGAALEKLGFTVKQPPAVAKTPGRSA